MRDYVEMQTKYNNAMASFNQQQKQITDLTALNGTLEQNNLQQASKLAELESQLS